MRYPTPRRDDLVEDLHGIPVRDPYRWMEDAEDEALRAWIDAQGTLLQELLAEAGAAREEIRAQLSAVWDYPKVGVPWRRGPRWFQHRNTGLQQQAVLWVMEAPDEEGRVLLDPNTLSADGTISLVDVAVSPDGALAAYGVSDGGSDWITWHVRDVSSGADLPDIVAWGKFSSAAWLPDSSGFVYGCFEPPEPGQELSGTNRNQKLRLHVLGHDGEDPIVHETPDEPDWGFAPEVTDDGRWLVVHVRIGTDPRHRLDLVDLSAVGDLHDPALLRPQRWWGDLDAEHHLVASVGERLLVQTDLDAPGGRVLLVPADAPEEAEEILPEQPETLADVRLVGGRLLVLRLRDATHELSVHDIDGTRVATVDLPDMGSVGGITGRPDDPAAHLAVSSFTASSAIVRLDMDDVTLTELRPPQVRVGGVSTTRVMVASSDGADIPLFVVRDLRVSGPQPTILYGYGGFGIPLGPEFRLWWSTWLQRGGAVAVGCYRGGLEYGREWHDAGRLQHKQHTFDDAAACASWLAAQPWTTAQHIAITGGSNGGLTAAMTMLQHPDAVGACVPEVGVLDLLRFHLFTIGWAWRSDYGDPDDADDAAWIHRISPYHQIRDRACYPPTLVVTADRDDRVVPLHSFKFLAALQHAQAGAAPVLGRIDTRAGHGAGTPTSKLIDARADVMAFLEHVLGRHWPCPQEE